MTGKTGGEHKRSRALYRQGRQNTLALYPAPVFIDPLLWLGVAAPRYTPSTVSDEGTIG